MFDPYTAFHQTMLHEGVFFNITRTLAIRLAHGGLNNELTNYKNIFPVKIKTNVECI